MHINSIEKRIEKMIRKYSKLTTPVNPFLLGIPKTCAPRTMLLPIVTFVTLPFFGCANGGGGEGVNSSASFISTSDQRQDAFGISGAAQDSAFVDWTKDARHQPGHVTPVFGGRGEP
jgi:hypothetical protein